METEHQTGPPPVSEHVIAEQQQENKVVYLQIETKNFESLRFSHRLETMVKM